MLWHKYGIAALCVFSFYSQADACDVSIRLALGSNWPPYYIETNGYPKGIEIIDLVFKKADLCVQYEKVATMARSLAELEKGNIDAVFAASYYKERTKYGVYSIPYRTEKIRIFWQGSKVESLKSGDLNTLLNSGLTAAINVGSYFGPKYNDYLNNKSRKEIVKIPTIDRKIKMLQHQRVDFVLEDENTGLYYLRENQIKGVEMHPYVVYQNEVAFLFNKNTFSMDYLAKLNAAITDSEKQISEIIARYGSIK